MANAHREARLKALKAHIEAHILMLQEEINLFLDNPVAVSGHTGYFRDIEDKISAIAEYEGMLTALNRFNPNGK